MFKLFSTPKPTQSAKEVATIEEIHNSFDIAADKALAQAKEILSANAISEQKAEHVALLVKAGFTSAKQVAETEDVRRIRNEATRRAETVDYFKQRYPQYKFIFSDQVDAICKKYGLICAEIARYMGEVPNKNLKEIIDFKINEEDDLVEVEYYNRWVSSNSQTLSELVNSRNLKPLKEAEKEVQSHNEWLEQNKETIEKNSYSGSNSVFISKLSKYICAPASEMRVYIGEKVENNKIVVSVPDPIVLQIVKGGFLVVSKWGIEGKDASLTNEAMN